MAGHSPPPSEEAGLTGQRVAMLAAHLFFSVAGPALLRRLSPTLPLFCSLTQAVYRRLSQNPLKLSHLNPLHNSKMFSLS